MAASKRKKLLICTDYLSAGGVESQTTALIAGLDRDEFDVRVLCFYGERAGFSLHYLPQLEALGVPVEFLDLAFDPQSKLKAFGAIMRHVWQFRPDILHAVNYHGNLLTAAARPFLPPGTRLIGASYTETTNKQLLYQRLSGRLFAGIIVNSPHLVEQLHQDAKLPLSKIVHIPNGLDVDRFSQNPAPNFRQEIAPNAARVLLMICRITPRKAPYLLAVALGKLKAAGKLPANVQAFIVGERENADEQGRIQAAIDDYGLQDVVIQHPQTDKVPAYYHAADVTVLVSLSGEGLPNVVLETLAAGKPMIVSKAANKTGVIKNGVNGWVVRTDDVEHLTETLDQVLSYSDAELAALHDACYQSALEYSMDKMVQRHVDLYRRVLGESN